MKWGLTTTKLLFTAMILCASLQPATAQDIETCLGCHADKGHMLEFPEGNRIEAFVDRQTFLSSVHGSLSCTDCHDQELTGKGHELRHFRSEGQFKLRYSRLCRRCHQDEQIGKMAVHASLLRQEAEGQAPICTDCHPAHAVVPAVAGSVLAGESAGCVECHEKETTAVQQAAAGPNPVHLDLTCTGCHAGYAQPPHQAAGPGAMESSSRDLCRRCHFDKYTKTLEGIHYALLSRGIPGTPDCVDCHGAHRVTSLVRDRATSAAKCGECHKDLYQIYASSVHGDALLNSSNQDVPVCSDCHQAHDIGDPLATSYSDDIPFICGNCHANPNIAGRYGLSTDVLKTYLEDFHGRTVSIYHTERTAGTSRHAIAVCTDCHGTHDIKSMALLGTSRVKELLLTKCRECHPGASANFPDAWLSHYAPTFRRTPLLFLANWTYRVILTLLLLGIAVQIQLHAKRHAIGPARAPRGARVRRYSTARIVEHLVAALLLLLLAATGLSQMFHDAAASRWLLHSLGGLDQVRQLHRYFGAALGLMLLLHVVVAAGGIAFSGWRASMLISRQDVRDTIEGVKYDLGVTSKPVEIPWFSFKEKINYWLLLLGCSTMVLSGLLLWFPVSASQFLPGQVIALAAMLHSHQALVVVLLVCAWHLYDVTLNPEVFPLDTSIFTGYTTRVRKPRENGDRTTEGVKS